jgi:hypothetical protein
MASTETTAIPAALPGNPQSAVAPAGDGAAHVTGWARFKAFLVKSDVEFSFLKGLSFVGFLSTLLVAYFQYLSAYQEKLNTQAKEDLLAATSEFTEGSNTLSTAITLQQILFYDYRRALSKQADADDKALDTRNARELYPAYEKARTDLRQNIDVLARKMEIYIDWASDRNRDPAKDSAIGADPMSRPMLGAYNFDCDKYMPSFSPGRSSADLPVPAALLRDDPKRPPLHLDWYSAKHHVFTIHYCFETAHAALETARAWASNSSVDPQAKAAFMQSDHLNRLQNALDEEVLRLNAFMSLIMQRLEDIRVKYRPSGLSCHIPIVREVVNVFTRSCAPIRTAEN